MARKQTIREAEETPTMDTDSFEDTDLYMSADGKGAVLGTLEADDKSKENKKTIAGAAGVEAADADLGGVQEDVFSELFDGEGLSETFKSKIKGVFEAEVSRRTDIITEHLKAEFQQELEEKVAELTEGMSGKVDEYLNYVVENWMEENKLAVTADLRGEFAEKYEHDKANLTDAVDKMVSERIEAEMAEFAEDKKQLAEEKVKYATQIREHSEKLKAFVFEQLKSEIAELHNDQKVMAENFSKLEDFVVEALSKEISEFQKDKQDVAETKVRLIREAKGHFEKVRNNFISKGADKVSEIVGKTLNKEISSLKDDIDAARKNDFGRRLFESYAQEYTQSFLNSKSETSKLLKVVDTAKQQLETAKETANEKEKIIESKNKEIEDLKNTAERDSVINELIQPLNAEQKDIMTNLLESVQTGQLRKQFEKYVPAVINGRSPAKKQALKEGTEVTGDKQIVNAGQFNSKLVDIKRLAGI